MPGGLWRRGLRILFIGNSRIGDFVLASGLLSHLVETHPDARLSVVCGPSCVPLLAEVPGVEEVIALRKRRHHRHWFDLWRRVVGTRWDLVVDLRNSAVSRLVRAGEVRRLRRAGRPSHRVEEIAGVLDLDPPPSPRIWLGPDQRAFAERLLPDGPPVLAIGPGATHPPKQWPAERFAELATILTGPAGILPGARVAVLGAPDEREAARPVLAAIPPERRLDLMDGVPILEAAAVIERCTLYVGNDNGQMHVSAAVGTPTLGLFGPTPAFHYRPWGARCAFVQTDRPFEDLSAVHETAHRARENLMESLPVAKVAEAARILLAPMGGT